MFSKYFHIYQNHRGYKNRTAAYIRFYKNAIARNKELSFPAEGEEEWLKRWRKYDKKLSPLAYRVFSRYIGPNIDILPMELCVNYIEPVLTPQSFRAYYSDKNMLDKIIGNNPTVHIAPTTYIRNIKGVWYDTMYQLLKPNQIDFLINNLSDEKVIVKPSLDNSGHGVRLFFKQKNGIFTDKNGDDLSLSFLKSVYKYDFLIQECFKQSDYISQFNTSSVNTIRMATYRDRNGMVHPLGALMRIGKEGSVVDNAHAGGRFVGIYDSGDLCDFLCNQYGERTTEFNGIDFKKNHFSFENFDRIQSFAVSISSKILHHDLVALDIALDQNDNPQIIEMNCSGFGGWLFQFTTCPALKNYTEEIMDYCFANNLVK